MTFHHCLALAMAGFLAWSSTPARPNVLGVVEEADRAHLNNGTVSPGATVYDGDRFSTERGGMLLLRDDAAMLELGEESAVAMRDLASGAQGMAAELSKGTLVFGAERAATFEVVACEAHVRPSGDSRTVAQVSVRGPRELRIWARRGALQFSYRGETETIAEGAAYRVILDPPDDKSDKKEPVKHRRAKAFLILIAGGGSPLLIFGLHEAFESPERP